MTIEQARLCGYRKVGGLYLCGEGVPMHCDRLPYELEICPVCGSGVKFTRGFQWLDWKKYAGLHPVCTETSISFCPICQPLAANQPYLLIWVGEQNYTPDEFIREAEYMGVSKRIPQVPRGLKLGTTEVLFAHTGACGVRQQQQENGDIKMVGIPGVFYAFIPKRVEQLIWKSHATPEKLRSLESRHITPIIIPDDDKDHDPETPVVPNETVRTIAKDKVLFDNMRSRLGK